MGREKGLNGLATKDATLSGACHGDPVRVVLMLGDINANHSKTRGRLSEFDIFASFGQGHLDFTDEFILLEGGFEQALKKGLGGPGVFIGSNRRPQGQQDPRDSPPRGHYWR